MIATTTAGGLIMHWNHYQIVMGLTSEMFSVPLQFFYTPDCVKRLSGARFTAAMSASWITGRAVLIPSVNR